MTSDNDDERCLWIKVSPLGDPQSFKGFTFLIIWRYAPTNEPRFMAWEDGRCLPIKTAQRRGSMKWMPRKWHANLHV